MSAGFNRSVKSVSSSNEPVDNLTVFHGSSSVSDILYMYLPNFMAPINQIPSRNGTFCPSVFILAFRSLN